MGKFNLPLSSQIPTQNKIPSDVFLLSLLLLTSLGKKGWMGKGEGGKNEVAWGLKKGGFRVWCLEDKHEKMATALW